MSNSISLNPMATTTASGLFAVNSGGFTQGDAQDDPAVKFALCGGVWATDNTSPVRGGMPIVETIPLDSAGNNVGLGAPIYAAAADYDPTGICVFNQAFGGITTPQSNAPLFSGGMSVNYYRFGSGARIPLPINPALTLQGETIASAPLYWDFVNNWITGTGTTTAFPVKILKITLTNNLLVSYDSVTGNANWTNTGALALCLI